MNIRENKAQLDVVAINRSERTAYLSDDTVVGITMGISANGVKTHDLETAVGAIAPLPDGTWLSIDLSQFDGKMQ